jgi:CubicO group peptidase (beta-lactamase class C family)
MMAINFARETPLRVSAVEYAGGAGLVMRAMNRKRLRKASAPILIAAAAAMTLGGCSNAAPPEGAPRVLAGEALGGTAADAIERLFADSEAMGETRALLVLRDGEVVYEAYGPGYGPQSKLISWSMAKSITSVLVGFLVSDGRLALDEPAPVPAWQRPGDPRGSITLRHLLHMSSGLEHLETGDPAWEADTVEMLFGEGSADMAGMAEAKPAAAQPNEVYNYSSATSVILSDIVARSLTDSEIPAVRRDAVRNLLLGRLASPLGMTSLTPEFDAAGTMVGGSIMHATARDYAKFGEFLRRRGQTADGTRLIPESWVDFMLTPSPADGGYGGHIWLNRPRPAGVGDALWPGRGPRDIFACLGHQGQFIIVSPSQRLTVVRLGISRDADQIPNVREALRELMAAL